MKVVVSLLLVAVLAMTALFAGAINLGMDLKEVKDTNVTDFINYMNENGIMDSRFYYYGVFLDNAGDYYVALTPSGFEYGEDLQLYFYDDNVEMFWFSDVYVDDDNYLYVLYVINEFANSYRAWSTLYIDNHDGCLASTTIMSIAGLESCGKAVWATLEPFVLLSDEGYTRVKAALSAPVE